MQRRTQTTPSASDDVVDLREYFDVLRRRIWIIVVTVGVVVALTAGYSLAKTPVYTAKAVVLVQPPESTQFRPDQLISLDTEARLVKSAPVAALANETINSSLPRGEFLKRVDVGVTPDTFVLDILYTDPSPVEAARGANAFAQAYLDFKEERARDEAARRRADIQSKIDEFQAQLEDLQGAEPGSADDQKAELLTAQIGVLTSELAAVTAETDAGEVILPAIPPTTPSSPKLFLNLVLGTMVALVLGVVLAFIRDRTDDRVSDLSDLELTIDAPVLGTIPHATGLPSDGHPWLIVERLPRSPAAEAFRSLRTSVIAVGRQRGYKTFALVSAAPGDGKTTTCANLGVALSHADSRVLLLAADLRKPTLAQTFGRELGIGTADVLMGEAGLSDAVQSVSPNLWLMTSGRPPGRPAELLQSPRLPALLAEARERFDFVLIDCPAVVGLADTLAVAPFADASLVVARVDSSKKAGIVHAVERLEQVGARIVGAILNDVPVPKRKAEYGYGYGYGYELDDEREKAASSGRGQRPGGSGASTDGEPSSTPAGARADR